MATEKVHVHCDVCIAGGGPAGIAAALSAARAGANTILCERYGILGGGLVASFVRPLLGSVKNTNIGNEIEKRLEQYSDIASPFERTKIVLTEMLQEAGVRVFLQTQITNAVTEAGRIVFAEAVSQAETAISHPLPVVKLKSDATETVWCSLPPSCLPLTALNRMTVSAAVTKRTTDSCQTVQNTSPFVMKPAVPENCRPPSISSVCTTLAVLEKEWSTRHNTTIWIRSTRRKFSARKTTCASRSL